MIPAANLPPPGEGHNEVALWVIASQACNLYNHCFQNVPVFELVAASEIDSCDSRKSKGDNPRALHVQARSEDHRTISLELDIQKRWWLPRRLLANLQAPTYHVRDALRLVEQDWFKSQWQDNFAGWLARSYTRVALPNAFNDAMRDSRLKDVIENKLIRHKEELYGIYLSIAADADEEWVGVLGEMPPPYLLNIVLATHEDADPVALRAQLVKQLFQDKIPDPENTALKITRTELAKRHNIRVVEAAVEAKSVSDLTLLELKSLIRYSLVDHLSSSSMAAG